MSDDGFRPTLYVLHGCPFCMKTMLFLGEAGLLDGIKVVAFDRDTPEEAAARATLEPHLAKVSYPAAEIAPGSFLADSDAIIAHFGHQAGIDRAALPALGFYIDTFMPKVGQLYRENMALKQAQQG